MSVCGENASVFNKTVDTWCSRLPDIVNGYGKRDRMKQDYSLGRYLVSH